MAPHDERWPQPSEPRYPDSPELVLTGQVPVADLRGDLKVCEKCGIAHKDKCEVPDDADSS